MISLDLHEVVLVLDTPITRKLGVANTQGVILGRAEPDAATSYAVLVGRETYSLHDADLRRTGRRARREDIYNGQRIRVSPDGEVLTAEQPLIDALGAAGSTPELEHSSLAGRHLTSDFYEQMQHRLRALLIITGGSISADQLALLSDLVDANENGVALEMLAEALVSAKATIDETTFDSMESLSAQMRLDPDVVDQLRAQVQ